MREGVYARVSSRAAEFDRRFAGGDTRRYTMNANKFPLARQQEVAYDAAKITARDREATEQERN